MKAVLLALLASLRAGFRSRTALHLEVLALRHQLAVYQRCPTRPRTRVADRLLWAWLSRTWAGWRDVLVFVRPSTVIAWQRRRFRDHWSRLSRARPGRPAVAKAVQELIRRMSSANPGWGSPRMVGELAKLSIGVAKSTIVLDERHLRRLLDDYVEHYHRWRCHRSLAMDCPAPRSLQGPEHGDVVEVAEAGGLYRHYERRAA
jgi:hypothetical protein